MAIEKVTKRKVPRRVELVDTLLWSQILNYRRFPGVRHGLAAWGEHFKVPKPVHEDWDHYSPEMRFRCQEDVRINVETYHQLMSELAKRKQVDKLKIGYAGELALALFVGRANFLGWPFNLEKARLLEKEIRGRMEEIEAIVNPQLRRRLMAVDNKEEVKSPAYLKNGQYASRTASWFEIDPHLGLEERPIWGDYCRVEVVQPEIGSQEAVKATLYEMGWKPTEFNMVVDKKTGRKVVSSGKLTEDSLEVLGEFGLAVSQYYSLRARHSVLCGWIEQVKDGRVHADCRTIGTPTRRSTHYVIANLGAEKTLYGGETRELFYAPEGWVVLGCDSKGNQLRCLAHWMNDPEFTKELIDPKGDVHSKNQQIIEAIIGSPMPGDDKDAEKDAYIRRDRAKRFIYAYLFGGGAGKTSSICYNKVDTRLGQKIKDGYMNAIPGLKRLLKRLKATFEASAAQSKEHYGYIFTLDGSPIFTGAERLNLCYLLQSTEKITVSLGLMTLVEYLEDAGIEYQPLIVMHDEAQLLVREEDAERVKAMAIKAFAEGPKLLGADIFAGDARYGRSWRDSH